MRQVPDRVNEVPPGQPGTQSRYRSGTVIPGDEHDEPTTGRIVGFLRILDRSEVSPYLAHAEWRACLHLDPYLVGVTVRPVNRQDEVDSSPVKVVAACDHLLLGVRPTLTDTR